MLNLSPSPTLPDRPILHIVGQTATGKTSFVLKYLSQIYNRKLVTISADSRQIYQELPIVSGADIPSNFVRKTHNNFSFFDSSAAEIHAVQLIKADQEWSAGAFRNYSVPIIERSWRSEKLPVIVGGTGLYHQMLYRGDSIPEANSEVRAKAKSMSVSQLQTWLDELDSERFSNLNESDQQNPRRLVRQIEMALAPPTSDTTTFLSEANQLWLGFTAPRQYLEKQIESRVMSRIQEGAVEEVKKLLATDLPRTLPVFSATGVPQIQDFLENHHDQESLTSNWVTAELQYSKRQWLWFKNKTQIHWFDVSKPGADKQAVRFLTDFSSFPSG